MYTEGTGRNRSVRYGSLVRFVLDPEEIRNNLSDRNPDPGSQKLPTKYCR